MKTIRLMFAGKMRRFVSTDGREYAWRTVSLTRCDDAASPYWLAEWNFLEGERHYAQAALADLETEIRREHSAAGKLLGIGAGR
jgi:hypothetical protein